MREFIIYRVRLDDRIENYKIWNMLGRERIRLVALFIYLFVGPRENYVELGQRKIFKCTLFMTIFLDKSSLLDNHKIQW
jgi:hypothetical protein